MARTLTRPRRPSALSTVRLKDIGRPPLRGGPPARRFRSEDEAWDAFLAGAREAVADSGTAGEVPGDAARALAAAVRACFEGPDSGSRSERLEAWLSDWRFVASDAEAEPRARTLGPEVMARLHEEVVRILNSADVHQVLGENGLESIANTPAEFAAMIKEDAKLWDAAAADAGLLDQ